MQDFRKLRVWQLSQDVADKVYEITATFPPSHRDGLKLQVREAADSVSSNIAEGCGRASKKEMAQFLQIAVGSTNEVDNNLIRVRRIGLLKDPVLLPLKNQVTDLRKMLIGLIKRVREGHTEW
jgi:four helix bundle protein